MGEPGERPRKPQPGRRGSHKGREFVHEAQINCHPGPNNSVSYYPGPEHPGYNLEPALLENQHEPVSAHRLRPDYRLRGGLSDLPADGQAIAGSILYSAFKMPPLRLLLASRCHNLIFLHESSGLASFRPWICVYKLFPEVSADSFLINKRLEKLISSLSFPHPKSID